MSTEKEGTLYLLIVCIVTNGTGAVTRSRDSVTSQRKQRASDPVSLGVRIEAGGKVEGEAGHVTVGHHFEDDILVAVTECRAEGVGGVGG